jgi:chitin disaccharide deacetylase
LRARRNGTENNPACRQTAGDTPATGGRLKLIITADDYGITPSVNVAIAHSIRLGMIDRTTALANAPFFADACELAFANNYENRIGIHFNLTSGMALSPLMAVMPGFCRNGAFVYKRNTRRYISRIEKEAVADECERQIKSFYAMGLHPTHLDSHHHVHTEWFIFQAIEPVLKHYGFTSVRISKNIGHSSFARHAYKTIFNRYLKRCRLDAADYFGDYTEIIAHRLMLMADPESIVEVMTHPVFSSEGVLVDAISGESLELSLCSLKANMRSVLMQV